MANPEHLEILKQGVEVWNKWREETDEVEVDLTEADLVEANLRGAYLGKANLQGAHLRGANLQGAYLGEANLQKAAFGKATLQEASFHDADFTGARGLLANQFAGANVSGAKLPEKIEKLKDSFRLKNYSKIPRNSSSPCFLAMCMPG